MMCESDRIEEDNLQLIDFSEEDDYLISFPFRDSLEDFRLSVSFECDGRKVFGGDVNSQQCDNVQSESMEPRRPSFLRKSLAWDSAFFNSAGVLKPEELFMINKGFKKDESKSNCSSLATKRCVRPPKGAGQDQKSSDDRLETLEGQLFEDVKPDIHKLSKRFNAATNVCGPAFGQTNALSCKKTNNCSQNKVKSVRAPKSQSVNLQGSKGNTKIIDPQTVQDKVSSHPKLMSSRLTNKADIEASDKVKMESKTRKAGLAPDQTVSKRSRWGDSSGLPKSTSFTSPTEKSSKVHRSYESSSSSATSSKHSSKFIRRKISPKNKNPTTISTSSLQHPSSSTCSSSTSVSSIDGSLLESVSPTSIMHQNSAIAFHNVMLESDFQSPLHAPHHNSEERKFASEYATRTKIGTLPFSGGSERKIKCSGLRMPSPKIGFFDEEKPMQLMLRGSMKVRFRGHSPLPNGNRLNKFQSANSSPSVSTENCSKDGKTFSGEHDGRKSGASCRKLKPDGHTPKERSRNGMNIERKRQKDESGSFQGETMTDMKKKQDERDRCVVKDNEKENVCDLEEQVNGLGRHFEAIDLNSDVAAEVKSQQICIKQKVHEPLNPSQLSLPATSENATPCSRTPLAEKMIGKQ